ncbi:DNA primase [Campylobacter hyointestinalis]|uniref:Toprim domain-containing protein n=2 Tax=Campylobacter fetus TaxID=196 RepID=A0A825BFW6_CAMFE|nr:MULTISPECIES: toprim domain-containing protein [Campylobacter]CBH51820.1 DNA primase [Campylobacter fetus subsp. fetus]EAI8859285.1 toprim domain-containing protein [Campylobacter fetus]EAI8860109.1 toprim domain-containing protein [Campylobacter fetus]EGK8193095.1 toprim domain-containing protein [Campylobacter fetus]EGK8193685.1 toprim domain-containing protein [Campylobacter fetus]
MNLHKDETRAFLEYLGFNVDEHYKFKMRNDEKTASASIDPKNGYIKDFGSGFRGDVIAFYKEIKACDDKTAFLETKKILDDLKIYNEINANHNQKTTINNIKIQTLEQSIIRIINNKNLTTDEIFEVLCKERKIKAYSSRADDFYDNVCDTMSNMLEKGILSRNEQSDSFSIKFEKEPKIEYLDDNIIQKYENERRENFTRYQELLAKLLPTCDNAKRKELAQNFQIGYSKSEDRLIMPLRDENGGIITLWKYNPNLNIKYTFSKDRPRTAFNILNLKEYTKDDRPIFIAEGEKDCLNMLSRGYKAISLGSASAKFKLEQTQILKDCYVVIAYDYDEAGRNGAKALKEQLKNVCNVVEVIDWEKILKQNKLEKELKQGFDFTDFLEVSTKQREIKKGFDR